MLAVEQLSGSEFWALAQEFPAHCSSPVLWGCHGGKGKAQQCLREEVVVLPGKEKVKRKDVKCVQLSPVVCSAGSCHSHAQLWGCALRPRGAALPSAVLRLRFRTKQHSCEWFKLGQTKHSMVPEKENCNLSLSHLRTCFLGGSTVGSFGARTGEKQW